MTNLINFWKERFLFFTGSISFKWINGIATLLMVQVIIMGVTGELIGMNYKPDIFEVKESLSYIKYNTFYGDWAMRAHKLTINVAFAVVFLHMFKGIAVWSGASARLSIWKSGLGILFCMYGASYAGCILPWNVLSPTLYIMIQTILDVYAGGWAVFLLMGGERMTTLILQKTLLAHVLLCFFGLLFLFAHIRFIHFNNSSINKNFTWSRSERPVWLPNEIVKELYVLVLYFFFFFYISYRKSMTFGSMLLTLFKFYYGSATNWNTLPASIEPEWYFWIFYFILASAQSLTGGIFRIMLLFISLFCLFTVREIAVDNLVFSSEKELVNSAFYITIIILSLIFFSRAKFQPWHTWNIDFLLFSFWFIEPFVYSINFSLIAQYHRFLEDNSYTFYNDLNLKFNSFYSYFNGIYLGFLSFFFKK